MNTYVEKTAPRISANAPVMLRNGVSSRSCGGNRGATGMLVAGSTAQPGGGSGVVTISTMLRSVAPTTATAASSGQRAFWKYVSTATARASNPATMKYSNGRAAAARCLGGVAAE